MDYNHIKVNWRTLSRHMNHDDTFDGDIENLSPEMAGSYPYNEICATKSKCCSRSMAKEKICYWHWCRMGTEQEIRCGCSKRKIVNGDATGRSLYYNYNVAIGGENVPTSCIDMGGLVYCCSTCQNSDNYHWKCGEMFVCSGCKDQHVEEKMVDCTLSDEWNSSDSSEDDDDDHHEDYCDDKNKSSLYGEGFFDAVLERRRNGKKIFYGVCDLEGKMTYNARNHIYGSYTVRNARDAIFQAGCCSENENEEREWWIWLCGWYEDCPEGITRHCSPEYHHRLLC